MEDQDRQRLAAVEQALASVTARLNALAEGNFELTAEGFRISSVRLFLKLVGSEYHLHQRDEAGTESDLTGAKSIWAVPIHDTAPTGGYVLVYNAGTGEIEWTAASTPGAHVLATTAGLGPAHTTSGLTARQVLRATGATTAAFGAIEDADLPATIARDSELHARLHAITDVLDHSATNWRLFYSDGSGHVVELALGADGTFLQSGGATTLPEFAALVAGDIPDISATYQVVSEKDAASGYAGLDGTPKLAVVQIRGLRESGGQALDMGAVADGKYLKRSGTDIVGDTPAGGAGDVHHQAVLPITDTLALNAEGPHVPILFAAKASSVDVIYVRSKTAMTATVTVYCYNQAGAQQWSQAVALAGVVYNSVTGLSYSIAANDYLLAKVTAYTSGGDEPLAGVRFKETAA